MGLLNRSTRQFCLHAVAFAGKLDDVNGAVAFNQCAVAGFCIIFDGLPENGGQTGGVAPAEVPAFHRIGRLGIGGSKLCKVLALLHALKDVFSKRLYFAPFLAFNAVGGQGQQDMLHAVFHRVAARKARLFGEIRVHFAFRNVDLGVNFPLAQPLLRDFIADLAAESRPGHTFVAQAASEFVRGELVVAGDLFNRSRHHLLVHTHADFARSLLHGLFRDEAVQHLRSELRHRRGLTAT